MQKVTLGGSDAKSDIRRGHWPKVTLDAKSDITGAAMGGSPGSPGTPLLKNLFFKRKVLKKLSETKN